MRRGFVKLFRKMVDWKWYKNQNTKAVFLHLLLMAEYGEFFLRGVRLARGEVLVKQRRLGEELGLSYQQVRTAFAHLEETGEITCRPTHRGMHVKLCNYCRYQDAYVRVQRTDDKSNAQKAEKTTRGATQEQRSSKPCTERISSDVPTGGNAVSNASVEEKQRTVIKELKDPEEVLRINKGSPKAPLIRGAVCDTPGVDNLRAIGREFERFFEVYPRKAERIAAERNYRRLRKSGVSAEDLLAAARNYAREKDGMESRYAKLARNFLGRRPVWREYVSHCPESRGIVHAPCGDEPPSWDELMPETARRRGGCADGEA